MRDACWPPGGPSSATAANIKTAERAAAYACTERESERARERSNIISCLLHEMKRKTTSVEGTEGRRTDQGTKGVPSLGALMMFSQFIMH